MAFLDRFETILFDLNGTLAVDFDRFGPDQDFHATYRAIGGGTLGSETLDGIIHASWAQCLSRYASGPPEPFPDYRSFLPDLDDETLWHVERTVAVHETGSIPRRRLDWLGMLADTHRLGIVSDQWAPSGWLRDYLAASGVAAMMQAIVLSCEEGVVKPSPVMFRKALAMTGSAAHRTRFVGDSYERDVVGAAACGMETAWISGCRQVPGRIRPSAIVPSVEALRNLD